VPVQGISRVRRYLSRWTSAPQIEKRSDDTKVPAADDRADRSAIDQAIAARLNDTGLLDDLHDPEAFIVSLRSCFEPATASVEWSRRGNDDDPAARRFDMVVAQLTWGMPPIRFADAWEICVIADNFLGNRIPYEEGRWVGDVGAHFRISSTTGQRGRLLTTIVRFMRATTCVELGTAYGMSALFILSELRAGAAEGRLVTIEPFDPQFSLASAMLEKAHPGRVICHQGRSDVLLPGVLHDVGPPQFVFHDAEHSGHAYRRDFEALEPALPSGAVVLYDDIRWDDRAFSPEPSGTYDGWTTVAAHKRVRRAVEIDRTMGLLLLG
jgi:predicted O-methyltransferase YrrM